MKISVIIPLYNHAAYIEQAVRSVLEQTYPDLELIIIDDGSRDNGADIAQAVIERFPERKAYLYRQENMGAHHAINVGLARATGDMLTVLNSDDYYHTERLSICMETLKRYDAECCFSLVTHVNHAGEALPPNDKAREWYSKSLAAEHSAVSISAQLLQGNIAVSSGNILFSRRLYELIGGFNDYKLAHDWDFLLRIIPHSEPVFVKQPLYFYRVHTDNSSHAVNQFLHLETNAIYRRYFETIASAPPANPYAPSFEHWPYSFTGFQHRSLMLEAIRSLVTQLPRTDEKATEDRPVPMGQGRRVTLVSHDLTLSGAPRLVADIAIYLQEQGFRPHILAIHGGELGRELARKGIPHSLVYGRLAGILDRYLVGSLRRLLTPLCLVWRYHRFKGPILFNTTVSQPVLLFAMLTMPRKRFIWYIHESVPPSSLNGRSLKFRLFNWYQERLTRSGRLVTWFGSKNTAALWQQEGQSGQVMYWSGIPASQASVEPREIKRILTAGTVDPRKGGHYLFEAFQACVKADSIPEDVVLTIVGFLPYYTEFAFDLLLNIWRSGIKHRVEIVGICDKQQLDALFAKSDLYVQASVMECMPIALLSAMSRGMPIITTDVDGCKEAIPDETCGWICPPRQVDALADAITQAVNDPDEAFRRAARARRLFNETFSKEVTTETLKDALFLNGPL